MIKYIRAYIIAVVGLFWLLVLWEYLEPTNKTSAPTPPPCIPLDLNDMPPEGGWYAKGTYTVNQDLITL